MPLDERAAGDVEVAADRVVIAGHDGEEVGVLNLGVAATAAVVGSEAIYLIGADG